MNILMCAHPDFDWTGGIEVEIHQKRPETEVVKKSLLRRSKGLSRSLQVNLCLQATGDRHPWRASQENLNEILNGISFQAKLF